MERGRGSLVLFVMLILLGFLLLSMLLRVQRGLLGLILTAILAVLGFYWFKEVRKALEQVERARE